MINTVFHWLEWVQEGHVGSGWRLVSTCDLRQPADLCKLRYWFVQRYICSSRIETTHGNMLLFPLTTNDWLYKWNKTAISMLRLRRESGNLMIDDVNIVVDMTFRFSVGRTIFTPILVWIFYLCEWILSNLLFAGFITPIRVACCRPLITKSFIGPIRVRPGRFVGHSVSRSY